MSIFQSEQNRQQYLSLTRLPGFKVIATKFQSPNSSYTVKKLFKQESGLRICGLARPGQVLPSLKAE